jgi:DNA polymerase-3 subunit delta'
VSNKDLSSILLKGFKDQRLSPFYILKAGPQSNDPRLFLETWMKKFLTKALLELRSSSFEDCYSIVENGHADILWPIRNDLKKNYSLKDNELGELFSFMEYGAMELPWRFAIIEDPHKLSPTYLNKLLKTLEEPAANTTVFFLNNTDEQFIDTIQSRAISLTIFEEGSNLKWKPRPSIIDTKKWMEGRKAFYPLLLGSPELRDLLIDFIDNNIGLADLIEKLKAKAGSDIELSGLVTEFESDRPGRVSQKERLCQELKWFEKSKTYNNAGWERSLGLLMVINS